MGLPQGKLSREKNVQPPIMEAFKLRLEHRMIRTVQKRTPVLARENSWNTAVLSYKTKEKPYSSKADSSGAGFESHNLPISCWNCSVTARNREALPRKRKQCVFPSDRTCRPRTGLRQSSSASGTACATETARLGASSRTANPGDRESPQGHLFLQVGARNEEPPTFSAVEFC